MSRKAPIMSIFICSVLMSGCVTHQTAKNDAASSLAAGEHASPLGSSQANGLHSMQWGDKWTATNLLEQATNEQYTISNRFNLAAGYQRTGRPERAAALYEGLVTDGQFTNMTTIRDLTNPRQRPRTFNVADESARRLATIRSMNIDLPTGSIANASAPGIRTGISDARALQLDEAARHERGSIQ
jgi:hypothetical protein